MFLSSLWRPEVCLKIPCGLMFTNGGSEKAPANIFIPAEAFKVQLFNALAGIQLQTDHVSLILR